MTISRTLLAATAALALSAPALAADKTDRVLIEPYVTKVAAAKADPQIAKNAGTLIERADLALASLRKNADGGDAKDTESLTRQIDALVEAAKLRAQLAAVKAETEQLQASGSQTRVQAAEAQAADAAARAAEAERKAAAAQQQAQALQNQLRQTQLGATMVLQDVIFETGRATLKPGAAQRLQPMLTYLRANPDVRVRIEGHTDSRGSDAYNRSLSQQRAEAVRTALATAGIDPSRIDAIGYGESRPVATNGTTAGQQANRRVEITLLGQQANQVAVAQ